MAGSRARAASSSRSTSYLLASTLVLVHVMARGSLWSPYYKITVGQDGPDTVVEVNNIFHQSMAPVEQKEYFYQWPYMVFGNTFENVLVLGAGSGTDVAAALKHGAKHVDAVEIDPVIVRLGRQYHPDHPYSDPRVTVVTDDARHFLRTTTKKYDLVVFALIDSLTMQSSFSGVRLESYMFTEESFRAVRERLAPDGLLVVYNYFRERWLVDRLANIAANAFGQDPRVHVHEARAYLGVLMAGPRLATLTSDPVIPDRVTAFGQSHDPSPARMHVRDAGVEPATDDWPFLYLQNRHIPSHYLAALALILVVSTVVVMFVLRGQAGSWSWQFFLLGAGFMLLETKSIIQFALLWGSTWVVASLAIASVLSMALVANYVVTKVEVRRPWLVGSVLLALLALNYVIPVGTIGFESRAGESLFYAVLMFSPILCAGLLFGSAIKRSTSLARDYGTNLLGAMVGGVGEYLSLVTGFRALLFLIAACYIGAIAARRRGYCSGRRRVPHLGGTRARSSSNQLRTTWICGAMGLPDSVCPASMRPTNLPPGLMSTAFATRQEPVWNGLGAISWIPEGKSRLSRDADPRELPRRLVVEQFLLVRRPERMQGDPDGPNGSSCRAPDGGKGWT